MWPFRREQPPLPQLEAPDGCVGRYQLHVADRHAIVNSLLVRRGKIIDATLACAGLCKPDEENEPTILARGVAPGDGGMGSGEPSRRTMRATTADVISRANQKAVLVCADCPLSVMREAQELEQARLRTQLLEERERQQRIAAATAELAASSGIDVRAMLGMEGHTPETQTPTTPELPPGPPEA